MKYIFYKIIFFNGKNKRIYKKKSSIKLYCKLNGKMIDIKKYKELCKKSKIKKVKSTKTKKTSKKVKSKKLKKTKRYRGGVSDVVMDASLDENFSPHIPPPDNNVTIEELLLYNNIRNVRNTEDQNLLSLYTKVEDRRSWERKHGEWDNNVTLIPVTKAISDELIKRGYRLDDMGVWQLPLDGGYSRRSARSRRH